VIDKPDHPAARSDRHRGPVAPWWPVPCYLGALPPAAPWWPVPCYLGAPLERMRVSAAGAWGTARRSCAVDDIDQGLSDLGNKSQQG